jgi:Spy/CpxP family protein refolding chaperone
MRGGNMNLRKALTAMVVGSMIFALAFAAEGKPFDHHLKSRAIRGDLGGLRAFLELKLSDSQQGAMMNIINKYQNERQTLRNSIMETSKNLSVVLQAEQFNEEHARKAFREASAVREELFVLNAKMRAELKAVLTPEQRAFLKERKAQRMERMRHRFDTRLGNKAE